MKSIILLILFFTCNFVFADPTGIWADKSGNYFSILMKGNKVVILDLSNSTHRAKQLKELEIEIKPEYLAYTGEISLEQYNNLGYFELWHIMPLDSLKYCFGDKLWVTFQYASDDHLSAYLYHLTAFSGYGCDFYTRIDKIF